MTQQSRRFPLAGGLDLVTPAAALPPGRAIASTNYVPTGGGYQRIRGFERFDGKTAPSSIDSYFVLHFTALREAITLGTRLVHDSGGPAGSGSLVVAADPVIISGTVVGGDAAGYVPVFVIAEPIAGEWLRIFGPHTHTLTAAGATIENEAVPEAETGDWLSAVRDAARSRIAAVTGSGPVRGVSLIAGEVVAVRDNAGATAGIMYRSTSNGWTALALATSYSFDSGGTFEPIAGDVLNGLPYRIVSIALSSGAWADGDAAGTVVMTTASLNSGDHIDVAEYRTSPDGSQSTHLDAFTLTSAGTAYALPPGGEYTFKQFNFYGSADQVAVYGVNGVGPAFVYDQDIATLSPISTGMTVDTPNRLAPHRGSLFLSFPGGSLQFSAVGNPLSYDAVIGAGEIGIGSDITDLIETNDALAILAENSINLLYGNDSSDYQLAVLTSEAGALPYTAQKIGGVVYMDNGGLRSLNASAVYGNFRIGSLSQLIAPLLEEYRRDGIDPVASLVSRQAGQYWCFLANGEGFVAYLGSKNPEFMTFDLGMVVTCAASVEDDGVERLFAGTSDGYVMELNKGTSFDGEPIPYSLQLPYFDLGNAQVRKRLHRVVLDLQAEGATTLTASVDFDNGGEPGGDPVAMTVNLNGRRSTAEVHLDGVGGDISMTIAGEAADEEPHTLNSATLFISGRGLARG